MSKACPKLCSIAYTNARSKFSTSSIVLKSHYDELGITPKATQGDIKTAYYKLTMKYHPDKNKTVDAKQKFRDISEAYKVLGNYNSRKMYDRGMRPGEKHTHDHQPMEEPKPEEDDPQTRFYKSRLNRSRVPTTTGTSHIYNFDEWTQAHYGNLMNRRMDSKAEWQHIVENRRPVNQQYSSEIMVVCIVTLMIVVCAASYQSWLERDLDVNKLDSKRTEEPVVQLNENTKK